MDTRTLDRLARVRPNAACFSASAMSVPSVVITVSTGPGRPKRLAPPLARSSSSAPRAGSAGPDSVAPNARLGGARLGTRVDRHPHPSVAVDSGLGGLSVVQFDDEPARGVATHLDSDAETTEDSAQPVAHLLTDRDGTRHLADPFPQRLLDVHRRHSPQHRIARRPAVAARRDGEHTAQDLAKRAICESGPYRPGGADSSAGPGTRPSRAPRDRNFRSTTLSCPPT